MPDVVDRWERSRAWADAETVRLLDQQIHVMAQRVLGKSDEQILLVPPSAESMAGPVNVGTILYAGSRGTVGLRFDEVLQHIAILGRSGAGKTNAAFHLLLQLSTQKVPWLFLDWKRTARHLIPRLKSKVSIYTAGRSLLPFPFNPFMVPPGVEPSAYANTVVDLLASAYTLGDAAASVLQTALRACYDRGQLSPTVDELLSEVERVPSAERVRGWKASALRALRSLTLSYVPAASQSQQEFARGILLGNTIVELDGLSMKAKQFLVPLLCLWLYHVQLGAPERERLQLVVFVEEAHHFLYGDGHRAEERVMEMLLRQCREVGMGMVVIDQHPRLLSRAVLGNTYTSLCFNLKDPQDVVRAAALSLLADDERRYLGMLPTGQAIVKLQDRWRQPFLVQVPLVDVVKGAMSDAQLMEWSRLQGADSVHGPGQGAQDSRIRQIRSSDQSLSDDALVLIADVLQNPVDGVVARNRRLGWSAERGGVVKRSLLERGWLESSVIPVGTSRKVVLRLTRQASDYLGIASGVRQESLAHEYWKRSYAKRYGELGYRVTVEAARAGGRVDVLAVREGERIGIEVETGKSDVVANVRNGLRSGLSRVFVVATDEPALTTVEKQLARASLLVPTRVQVVLRDDAQAWGVRDDA